MPNENNETVRILDVIKDTEVRAQKPVPEEFHRLPLYEMVEDGVLKANYGRRKRHDDYLYYDVTNASEQLRSAYASKIEELEVKRIIGASKQKSVHYFSDNIVALLSLTGCYSTLSSEEQNALGHDFVTLIQTPEGIKVKPVLSLVYIPDNMSIRVDNQEVSEELYEKIASEVIELAKNENDLYHVKDQTDASKEL